MQHSGKQNDFVQPIDLESLANLRSDQGPIFSLYLDLSSKNNSERKAAHPALDRFNELLREVEQEKKLEQETPEYQEQWHQEAERIRGWLQEDLLPESPGLAVLSSYAAGLWQVIPLPVPVTNQLVIKGRPFVRPLEILFSEFQCTLVLLADQGLTRLVRVFLGRVEEITFNQAVPVTGGNWTGTTRDMIDILVELAEKSWQEQRCGQVILGGSEESIDLLREALPESMRERVAGELSIHPQSGLDEILAEVKDIEKAYEHRLEEQRVDELTSSAKDDRLAVLGLEQTLLSVRGGKVRLLVTEEGFHLAGGECPNCGFLGEGKEGVCLLCGVALRPEPDIIEAAMKRVLDQGAEVEVLRSEEFSKALAAEGRIGALIYATDEQKVQDYANRRIIREGENFNPDVLHDEAIEESFPASDSPAF